MGADRQTTGGYTKIANVISADFRLLGQLKAGDKVRFEKVSIQEAQQAPAESAGRSADPAPVAGYVTVKIPAQRREETQKGWFFMAFDITPYIDMKPAEVRRLIREGVIDFPTAGMCRGYAQANPGHPAPGVRRRL